MYSIKEDALSQEAHYLHLSLMAQFCWISLDPVELVNSPSNPSENNALQVWYRRLLPVVLAVLVRFVVQLDQFPWFL